MSGDIVMYRLRKIKELKGYRFFQNFKWDENNCSLFNQNNLIYGWNGSGKTTLCDFFRELEEGQLSSTGINFSLLFEDTSSCTNSTISQNQLGTIPYIFKVFHQNYIQENISTVDNVKHIFSVGKGQMKKIDEVKRLKTEVKIQEAQVKKLEGELEKLQRAFEQLKTEKAKIIKDAAKYTNAYNKHRFYSAYQALTTRQTLSEAEYQKALTAIRAEQRPPIDLFKTNFIQPTVKDYISGVLKETPVNITIEALKKDIQVSNWVEQGLSLHEDKNSETCLFCGNRVSENRFEELRAHFNKSYKELSDKIDAAIKLLYDEIQQFETAKASLPNSALLYPELQNQYVPLQITAQNICEDYTTAIEKIIEILKKKKSDMIGEAYVDEFITLVDQLLFDYGVFEEILKIIGAHNKKTSEFQKSISNAKKLVENHHISEFADEIISCENAIKNKSDELAAQRDSFDNLTQRISNIEQEVRNSQIPADAINKDIEFIMGRSELVFANSNLGYQITRKGKKAKNLSKGEENAIALIYFFNTLLDVDADVQNTIVVLDDPISSFDSNFYYNAISYIREKTSQVGQTFIFTHKFSLLKDYSLMYKGNTNRYTIQRVQDAPQIMNEDKLIGQYHDEYAYLFKRIYSFVKNPPSDTSEYLQYPNMARRLLEGFLTFKLPLPNDECSMIDRVLELEKDGYTAAGRAILRLLNNRSHLRVISSNELVDDIDSITILPDILKHLLEFMKHHDEKHYNTLAALCDPEYNENGDAIEVDSPVFHKIKLYEISASAGTGNFIDNDSDYEEIEVSNADCTFAVKISGDSMEPDIANGSIALVKQCDVIPNAHIGIVWYNGNSYCKKIVQHESGILLVSVNKAYKPITVISTDEFRLFGEVVEILDSNKF